jgi:hypothetical protein
VANPVPNQPGGNPLEDLIPVDKRKKLYAVLGVFALVLSVLQVAVLMTNTDGHEPMWLKVVIVCYNLLTAPVLGLANANAKPKALV